MVFVKREICKCNVCGHEWLPRNDDTPLRCGGCKSPYWNRKKKVVG